MCFCEGLEGGFGVLYDDFGGMGFFFVDGTV